MVPDRLAEQPGRKRNDRQRLHKLRQHEIDELVAAYQAGTTAKELGERFKLNKKTVGRHLRARGIQTASPGLEEADLPAAVRLYQDGWSLARIAAKFGSTDKTVRKRLLAAGVRMRDPQGRER